MPKAAANGIEIEYEVFGAQNDRPLLLIMGLGAQMVLWDDGFCQHLVDQGHCVIRFDNRDVGLSSKFEHAGVPDVASLMMKALQGRDVDGPYSLVDMADDTAGLLDALGVESAHIVGASMGGMIAQTFAIHHPARARSLTSIMSTTGNREVPPPRADAVARLMAPPATDREGAIERSIETFRVIGSPGFERDEDDMRTKAALQYDRCFLPCGQTRQFAAIVCSPNREPALRSLELPSLVIHGTDDPLVPVEGGKETAGAIPGAEWLPIEGMGHDMPKELHPKFADAISAVTSRADGL